MPKALPKKYVSVDVEASGISAGKYSMLSIGACIVGQTDITFYREMKPISRNFIKGAMKVACLGLSCLRPYLHLSIYNPRSNQFMPEKALDVLEEEGDGPIQVMDDFASWILEHTEGFRPIEAAHPIKYDGSFTAWYFDNFYPGENPLGHSGENLQSFLRGFMRDRNADFSSLMPKELPHHALEDAIIQAEAFEKILRYCA